MFEDPSTTEEVASAWGAQECDRLRAAGVWRDERLDELLRRSAAADPARTAVVDPWRRLSYAQLDLEVDRAVRGLRRVGIAAGDRVVVQLPNRAEFLIGWFALVRLGAVPVHAMPAHGRAEVEHLARSASATALLVADRIGRTDHRGLAVRVREAVPSVHHVVVVGDAGPADLGLRGWEDMLAGADADAAASEDAPDLARGHELALLLLSGGTTGMPKLIPRTHADYAYNARAAAEVSGFGPETVFLVVLPVAFNFPMCCPGVLGVLGCGGTVVLCPSPDPEVAFGLIAEERVTVVALTPPLARAWMEERPHTDADLGSLAVVQVGGARLDPVTARQLEPVLGVRVQQVFGMAEGLLCMTRPDDPDEVRWGTQGRPVSPLDEVQVLDEDGRAVADGEPGSLLTRGPYTLRGYYGAPEADRIAFGPDRFLRTGDVVRRHPGGNLEVVGRLKDQINRGGEKIAAPEVEALLLQLPGVRGSALLARADPDLGERSVAVLTCVGAPPDRRRVSEHLAELGVARYKHPDVVVVVDRFPLTAVGKVDKRALAAQLEVPA